LGPVIKLGPIPQPPFPPTSPRMHTLLLSTLAAFTSLTSAAGLFDSVETEAGLARKELVRLEADFCRLNVSLAGEEEQFTCCAKEAAEPQGRASPKVSGFIRVINNIVSR